MDLNKTNFPFSQDFPVRVTSRSNVFNVHHFIPTDILTSDPEFIFIQISASPHYWWTLQGKDILFLICIFFYLTSIITHVIDTALPWCWKLFQLMPRAFNCIKESAKRPSSQSPTNLFCKYDLYDIWRGHQKGLFQDWLLSIGQTFIVSYFSLWNRNNLLIMLTLQLKCMPQS